MLDDQDLSFVSKTGTNVKIRTQDSAYIEGIISIGKYTLIIEVEQVTRTDALVFNDQCGFFQFGNFDAAVRQAIGGLMWKSTQRLIDWVHHVSRVPAPQAEWNTTHIEWIKVVEAFIRDNLTFGAFFDYMERIATALKFSKSFGRRRGFFSVLKLT